MRLYKIKKNKTDLIFEHIGCDKAGVRIMSKKTDINMLYIKDLSCGATNILKQETISVGADLATPKGAIVCDKKFYDVVLFANDRQLEILSIKLKIQPFELKELSNELKSHKTKIQKKTKIMAVLNINDDSFYKKSQTKPQDAIYKIERMIEQKADIIDIGAVSSRPDSKKVSAAEEMSRIKDVIKHIYKQKLYDKIKLSIDSYEPTVIQEALEHGFSIVNDITGLQDDSVANLVARFEATPVIMHMQGTPQTMQDKPVYEDVVLDIDNFFEQRIKKAKDFGIKNMILDVGIGFGKTLEQNLRLLKHITHFQKFSYELLVGVSRKSMIDKISPSSVDDRLAGSLSSHIYAVQNGVSIIRCHDVAQHRQAFDILEAIDNITI